MNTNIKITTSEEDRKILGAFLETNKPISRKELDTLVQEFISGIIKNYKKPAKEISKQEPTDLERRLTKLPSADGFSPSRGDEEYLNPKRDPELLAACKQVLDGLTNIENFVWTNLER